MQNLAKIKDVNSVHGNLRCKLTADKYQAPLPPAHYHMHRTKRIATATTFFFPNLEPFSSMNFSELTLKNG